MSLLLRQGLMLVVLMFAVSGCSSVKKSVNGWLGDEGDTRKSRLSQRYSDQEYDSRQKFGVVLRVKEYEDKRKVSNPRWLGNSELPVRGMPRNQVVIDQEVASVVTASFVDQFDANGYLVLQSVGSGNAMFEVSGVIKELTLNVKDRDEIFIGIETTVKEAATGKIVWSGLVKEKNDRFAGVSGNNKGDIEDYLGEEVDIVSDKTVEAVSASLMAARPDLFSHGVGGRVQSGVTVYTSAQPASRTQVAPAAGAAPVYSAAPPVAAPAPFSSTTMGLVVVNTTPPRARIYLDDVYYGLTPLRIEMDPGIHAISVKLSGYKMATETISVRKGGVTEMDINLER